MNNLESRKKKALAIVKELKKLFPAAKTELNFSNPHEILFATIMSAQATDKQVNKVTETLFKKYKTVDDFAKTSPEDLAKDMSSVNFYRNKAKSIVNAAKMINEKFGGKVPKTMEEMLQLPGVARKTANVTLSSAYGIITGIAVDTHVKRLSKLLDLTDQEDPPKIEKDLMELLPEKEWMDFSYRLILYGRKYCPAREHDHQDCPLSQLK